MKLIDIINEIDQNRSNPVRAKYNEIKSDLDQLNWRMSQLNNLKFELEVSNFTDYIKIGETYEFINNTSFEAIQVGKNKSNNKYNNNILFLEKGDIIQFIRKNKKSISIRIVNKMVSRYDYSTSKYISYKETPNTEFRVKIEPICSFIMYQSNFKEAFQSYIKRKEALDELVK